MNANGFNAHRPLGARKWEGGFETKYGMPFAEFAVKWQADSIPQRRSHEIERDFMEWEAWQMEQTRPAGRRTGI